LFLPAPYLNSLRIYLLNRFLILTKLIKDKPIHRSDSRLEYLPDNITGQYENVQNCPLLSESKPIPHLQSQFRARKFTYGSDTSDYHSYNAANDDNQTFDHELDADLQGLELDQSNEKQTA